MTRSLVFTGHRQVRPEDHSWIVYHVEDMAADVDHFYVGGATGADSYALSVLSSLHERNDDGKYLPAITVVVPSKVSNQPRFAQQAIGRAILIGAEIIEMGLPYNAESLRLRNRKMIDLAKEQGEVDLVAYWHEGVFRSGTYSTINYYKKLFPDKTIRYCRPV